MNKDTKLLCGTSCVSVYSGHGTITELCCNSVTMSGKLASSLKPCKIEFSMPTNTKYVFPANNIHFVKTEIFYAVEDIIYLHNGYTDRYRRA